jgi:hypothetical protein
LTEPHLVTDARPCCSELLLAAVFTCDARRLTLPPGTSLFQGDRLVIFGQRGAASLTGIAPAHLGGSR